MQGSASIGQAERLVRGLRRRLLLQPPHVVGRVVPENIAHRAGHCRGGGRETACETKTCAKQKRTFKVLAAACDYFCLQKRSMLMRAAAANPCKAPQLTWLGPMYRSISCSRTGAFALLRISFDAATTI
jgi:hypothetical protein